MTLSRILSQLPTVLGPSIADSLIPSAVNWPVCVWRERKQELGQCSCRFLCTSQIWFSMCFMIYKRLETPDLSPCGYTFSWYYQGLRIAVQFVPRAKWLLTNRTVGCRWWSYLLGVSNVSSNPLLRNSHSVFPVIPISCMTHMWLYSSI